jgi:hypothetical protein
MTASEQTATSSRAVPRASRTYHRAARRSTRRPRPHAPASARDSIARGSPKRSYRANHAPRRSVRVERAPATLRSSHPGGPGNAAKSDRLRKDGPREWPSHAHLRKHKGRSRPVQAHSRACRCPRSFGTLRESVARPRGPIRTEAALGCSRGFLLGPWPSAPPAAFGGVLVGSSGSKHSGIRKAGLCSTRYRVGRGPRGWRLNTPCTARRRALHARGGNRLEAPF